MLGERLVEQAEGVRQRLGGEDLQAAAVVVAGQVAGLLAAPVEHQHAAGAAGSVERCGEGGRRGVRDVVRNEAHLLAVQPGQRGGEEPGGRLGVGAAQVVPRVVQAHVLGGLGEGGVEGVGDRVEVLRAQARLGQAPAASPARAAPRRRTAPAACRACGG